MPDKTVVIVEAEGGDWIGVYVDGRLAHQGHDIEPGLLLECVGVPCVTYHKPLAGGSRFPNELDQL